MLSVQHTMCLFAHEDNPDSRLIAATVYPDAIRAYSGPRQYSHFEKSEDGEYSYYMEFPEDMHASKEEVQALTAQCEYDVNLVRPCVLGEDTDLKAFYDHNQNLDGEMFKGINYHLNQDIVFDDFIRREIDCTGKYDDKFIFQGEELNGKDVRGLIGDIEQHGIYVLAHKLYEEKGITANKEWFEENIKPALEQEYSQDLADKTFSYMNIRPDIDKLITEHDWSKLNEGPLPIQAYNNLYERVETVMELEDTKDKLYELDLQQERLKEITIACEKTNEQVQENYEKFVKEKEQTRLEEDAPYRMKASELKEQSAELANIVYEDYTVNNFSNNPDKNIELEFRADLLNEDYDRLNTLREGFDSCIDYYSTHDSINEETYDNLMETQQNLTNFYENIVRKEFKEINAEMERQYDGVMNYDDKAIDKVEELEERYNKALDTCEKMTSSGLILEGTDKEIQENIQHVIDEKDVSVEKMEQTYSR